MKSERIHHCLLSNCFTLRNLVHKCVRIPTSTWTFIIVVVSTWDSQRNKSPHNNNKSLLVLREWEKLLEKGFPRFRKVSFFAFNEVFFCSGEKNTFLFYYFSVLWVSDARKSLKKNRKALSDSFKTRNDQTIHKNPVFVYTCRDN